ncbi:PLP-dependent aminotransferase family protein [Diaphorobacter aerolatus]|uniref:PLP-dependent aminotransferase family protein n=2 Tax=Diaphorobacter aerolatus TaxID=1288495 RepID=A0A7H0GQ91_9BURK|nr:PLP-dependent aminotransferase family protein [Diaphorobacter aerolatus]
MWEQLFHRSAKPGLSLQGQIREMIVSAILTGVLTPGDPVPSSRELARHLSVGRITVVLAYQQLTEEAFLLSRQRKGHFIHPDVLQGRSLKAATQSAAPAGDEPAIHPADWNQRLWLRPSQQRSIVKEQHWQDYPYPFLYGQFDKDLFPMAAWRECCIKALSVLDIQQWAPDYITRDDDSLIHEIQTKVLPRRGVWASPEEIIITVGAQHALYMVGDLLLRDDSHVGMEDPGYPDARNVFSSRTSQLKFMQVDGDGLPLSGDLRDLDYLYVTPSHQCPTGVTMPLERRHALLNMAHEEDIILIEDDYESESSFDEQPVPALKSLDRSNRVIYVGSLSKSLAPGLRIGYIVAAPELVLELRALRRLMIRHPTTFVQRTLSMFLSLGHYEAQLRRLAQAQKDRHTALIAAMNDYLPECRITPVRGGGSCWVQLPDHVSALALARSAAGHGVLIEPGDVFFKSSVAPGNFVRLGYQSIPTHRISDGIRALAEAMREV